MKKYKVTVNGNVYEIELEEINASEVKSAPAAAATSAPRATIPAASNGEAVTSPMPGTVLNVNVANGASVKQGQVLMVLEAMKMENEIVAPCDGIVSSLIAKGSTVETGAVLCVIV